MDIRKFFSPSSKKEQNNSKRKAESINKRPETSVASRVVKKERLNKDQSDRKETGKLAKFDEKKNSKACKSKEERKKSPEKLKRDEANGHGDETPPKKRTKLTEIKASKEDIDSHKAVVIPPSEVKASASLSKKETKNASLENISDKLRESVEPSLLFVEKYKPTSVKAIIGQQGERSNMRKLMTWLQNWKKHHASGKKPPLRPPPWNTAADSGAWAKAAILSGPPGVGKTTTAYLVSKELGYDVMELNASDTRSKRLLEESVSEAISSSSLGNFKKRILLMDEVDGMAGNEDRGGVAELIQLIKRSKIPVVCMCNDRNHPKIRSLSGYCFDLRFQRPRADQIKAGMMSVCFKEKIKIAPDALMEIISGCNHDIRQILHHLSLVKARQSDSKYEAIEAKSEAEQSKKTSIKMGPWDVVRKVFSAAEHRDMNLFEKSDLFFQDYSLGPLFAQESYLLVEPHAARNKIQVMELVSKAADSFCQGDLVDSTIRTRNAWNLLPIQAMFSSVIPGEYMSGHITSQIQFPAWFGKHSKRNKFDRILQELQTHTRMSSGVSKKALNEDLIQALREHILRPMKEFGADGVSHSVSVMKRYSLLREDLDNLIEICQWPNREQPMKNIDSKVKAAFTRQYNKEVQLPYSSSSVGVRVKAALSSIQESVVEEDEVQDDENEEDDIAHDSMIKAKKTTKGRHTQAINPRNNEKSGRRGKPSGGRGGKKSKN